ncbi:MAG: protein tyrosine phosphatase II superfamily protein [uncultured bacterium]|nr:MAG: protein tyrosine phosphatase II superfamily protein [uncultured bacterium]
MLLAKRISLLLALIIISMASALVWAKITKTLLVIDMQNKAALPRNFRSSDILPAFSTENINWLGFSDLHIAGGAQFSEESLRTILQTLKVTRLTIIDLRQESHGFLDSNAISWYGPQNAANVKLTDEQVEKSEAARLNLLNKHHKARVYEILSKTEDGMIDQTKMQIYPVQHAGSERELVEKYQLNYHRFYVQDFHAPVPNEVDRFVNLMKDFPKNEVIYFHCRAGVGRTTTFMVMYDMMRNAKQVSFDDILTRHAAIGGKDINELPDEGSFKYKAAEERLEFLKRFYEYSRSNDDNFKTTWATWGANN